MRQATRPILRWLTSRREGGLTPLEILIVAVLLVALAAVAEPQAAY